MSEDALALLKRNYTDVWDSQGWKDFRTYRADHWDPVIRRKAPQSLHPAAAQFLQATNSMVDIQSPDLEKDLHDRVAILLSNSVKIDAISLDKKETAKKYVEDIRIWSAGSWLRQNDGYDISRHIYEQMCRYGVATLRKTWAMPPEPDNLPSDPDKALQVREEYYRDSKHECFGWQPVSPLELAWFPLRNPEIFVQESVIPYVEARSLENREGFKFRLTKDNKAVFVGESQPVEEFAEHEWEGKKVHVTIRAALNKDTGRWDVTEWARGGDSKIDDAAGMDEYTCPFEHAPYFIAPSGDELVTETNPHYRYRPMIYPLIVAVQELNALVTLLVMVCVWHLQNPFVIQLDGLTDAQTVALEGMQMAGLGFIEGTGAERKFVYRLPEPGSGEIMAVPRLQEIPHTLPDAFVARIQQVQQSILDYRANRYLTGEAFDNTREQPATSTLNQAEAAATPFGTYLTSGDRFTKEWLVAEHEAICYWDEGSEKGTAKPYPIRTRGDEPLVSNPHDAGEVVTLTAEKLKTPYILICTTRNETQAEHAMNQQLADVAYEKGSITQEQWLRQRGADDPQKQKEDLWADKMEQTTDAYFEQVYTASHARMFQAFAGAVTELEPMGQPQQGPPGAQNGNGTGGPMLARPQMTPAPLAGPVGGNNPGGGGIA